jgi:nitrous oxidase accessory protein NosD
VRNPGIGVLIAVLLCVGCSSPPTPLTVAGQVTHTRIQHDGTVYARILVGTNVHDGVWVRDCTLNLTTSDGTVISGTVPGLTITGAGQQETLRGTLVQDGSPVHAANAVGFSSERVTSCLASTDKSAVMSGPGAGQTPRVSVQG